jgi:hypothetical protein
VPNHLVDAVGAEGAVRSWRRAACLAGLSVWLPVLVPVCFGLLRDCGHCARTYWLCSALVPGLLPSVLLQLDDAVFFVVAAAVTLGLFGGLAVALRELPRPWHWVAQGPVAVVSTLSALGFAMALRA